MNLVYEMLFNKLLTSFITFSYASQLLLNVQYKEIRNGCITGKIRFNRTCNIIKLHI